MLVSLGLNQQGCLSLVMQERRYPGAIQVASRFGPHCLPLLCGPDADQVIKVLVELPASPTLGSWLRQAGWPGLNALKTYGPPLVTFLENVAVDPKYIALACRCLEINPQAVDFAVKLFRFFFTHEVPVKHWPFVDQMLHKGFDDQRILLSLFLMGQETP